MRRVFITLAIVCSMILSGPVRADLFGGDVAVLTQILANALQQLAQLKNILESAKGNLELMREVHKGINQALELIKTVDPNWDPGLYRDWTKIDDALRNLEHIYGKVSPSPDSVAQKDTDQVAAEAIALNNSLYAYTRQIDELGERIKQHSLVVSPGGAQRLTAQSMGAMLHVMNQELRAQATGLKVQAQSLAMQNKKEKASTEQFLNNAQSLQSALREKKTFFSFPRF